jgi:thiamine biosynthesis lipoprotein
MRPMSAPRDESVSGPGARRRAIALVVVVLGALGLWRWAGGPRTPVHDFRGPTMGATYAVRVAHPLTESEHSAVRTLIEERVDRVEGLMSTYDPTSELSRFNRQRSTEPFPVTPELLEVVSLARLVSELSGGALDVTVGPLVEAWGFGPGAGLGGPLRPLPSDVELAALRERVGYALVELDLAAGTMRKTMPDVAVDVGAIATGYAAELVADGLRGLGLTNYLVDVGGELQAGGTGMRGRPWRIGVEVPDEPGGAVWGTVSLSDEGIATSGDYRDYYELEGVRYAHIVDPRSGRPIPMRGASVTVVHPRAALADAWATALTVLGPVEGMDVARREGLAAIFLEIVDGRVEAQLSPVMAARAEAIGAGG